MSQYKKTVQPTPLRPILTYSSRRPYNMDKCECSREYIQLIDKISLGIFTDMANAGRSFSECLSAIYLSGVQHAVSILEHSHD